MAQSAENSTKFDATEQQIGQSYAAALLGAAEKAGNLETVVEEVEAFVAEVLYPLPKLRAALESPRIPEDAKLSMIDKAVGGKVSQQFHNFLRVVAQHGRLECLPAIAQQARKQLNEKLGRVEVYVKSAYALSDDLLGRIADKLRTALESEIHLQTSIEPELIGGLEIRIGDTVFDGTIVRQLTRLRDQAYRKAQEEIRHRGERFASA